MSNILIALQITALGMGLVFAAIILLWWMMAGLTGLMAEKDTSSSLSANESDATEVAPIMDHEIKARVAELL